MIHDFRALKLCPVQSSEMQMIGSEYSVPRYSSLFTSIMTLLQTIELQCFQTDRRLEGPVHPEITECRGKGEIADLEMQIED